jgi:hypothetical protein
MRVSLPNHPRRRSERGFLVIALLALLSIMLIYIAANLHVLAALKRDVRIVEQKQIHRWEKLNPQAIAATNAAPDGLSHVAVTK